MLFFGFLTSEYEPKGIIPGFGFPLSFKKGPFFIDPVPAFALLDHLFELRKPFKWHRGRKFNMFVVKNRKNILIEKGGLDP